MNQGGETKFYLNPMIMIRLIIFPILFCIMFIDCGQKNKQPLIQNKTNDTILFNKSIISVIPFDTTDLWLSKEKGVPATLSNRELQNIEKLLTNSINVHNSKQDTTKSFSEFINFCLVECCAKDESLIAVKSKYQ